MKKYAYGTAPGLSYSFLAALLLAGCTTLGNMTSSAPTQTAVSGVLTNINGMTLYVYDNDPKGKSLCSDACAKLWPPLLVHEGDRMGGDYSVVIRDDGRKQWAYKGKPLYLWLKDKKPGDKTGDGIDKLWHAAKS